jgi:ribosome-associated toxin RatA of RatAB toxin-antitoxin module
VNSVLRIVIAAPYDRIFDLAAEVERWPERLPHYRYVRRLPGEGERRFEMGARRGAIPVSWEAVQRPMRAERRIEFTHTGGLTRGMEVAWRFEPALNFAGEAWQVSIEHTLDLDWPLVGGFAADHVIGPQFIEAIAGKTLATIRDLAERGA